MVLFFSCDEVIQLLNLILINENINNQVVKIGCENQLLLYMSKSPYLKIEYENQLLLYI